MINLLPPHYKEELQREEQFRLVLILGLLVIAFFICLSLSLLSIRVYILGEIQAQQILVDAQREEGGDSHIKEMQGRNAEIGGVASFYKNRTALSHLLERVAAALPEGIYLTSFTYAPMDAGAKIALAGRALQTEDLLALRTSLERDPSFENFNFPPSNWIRAADIDFSFTFDAKQE